VTLSIDLLNPKADALISDWNFIVAVKFGENIFQDMALTLFGRDAPTYIQTDRKHDASHHTALRGRIKTIRSKNSACLHVDCGDFHHENTFAGNFRVRGMQHDARANIGVSVVCPLPGAKPEFFFWGGYNFWGRYKT